MKRTLLAASLLIIATTSTAWAHPEAKCAVVTATATANVSTGTTAVAATPAVSTQAGNTTHVGSGAHSVKLTVGVGKAYFYTNEPTPRISSAYVLAGDQVDLINVRDGNWAAVSFTNNNGKVTTGLMQRSAFNAATSSTTATTAPTLVNEPSGSASKSVVSTKAYFHSANGSRLSSYVVAGQVVQTYGNATASGFIMASFTNSKGKVTKHYLKLSDLAD